MRLAHARRSKPFFSRIRVVPLASTPSFHTRAHTHTSHAHTHTSHTGPSVEIASEYSCVCGCFLNNQKEGGLGRGGGGEER